MGDLMPLLDPSLGKAIASGIHSNTALIVETLNALNPAILASALNAHPEVAEELSRKLPPSLAVPVAQGLSLNPGFLGKLMESLDPRPVAAALGAHTDLVKELLGGISPNVARAMTEGSNLNPQFLASLISHLDARTVAGALNANPSFLKTLLRDLSGEMGKASALGLKDNWLAGRDFLAHLVAALDPDVIAAAVNENPGFLRDFLANTSAEAGMYVAQGINLNVTRYPLGRDLLSSVIANISEDAAAALAEGINRNVEGSPTDNLLVGLLANSNGDAGAAIARGINQNTAFVKVIAERISPTAALAVAQGINLSCQRAKTDPNYRFLRNLLAQLGPAAAVASAQGLDTNPQRDALVAALLHNLNAAVVGPMLSAALNANAASQTMIQSLVAQLNPDTAQTIALALNANPDMTHWMLGALDPHVVADLLNGNPSFLSNLISNLDGRVIANAINEEYKMHPGNSFLERLMSAMVTQQAGRTLAETLNDYGYDFLLGLINNLDGAVVASAINGNPGAKRFMTDLLSYLDPYDVVALINNSSDTGALKYPWFQLWSYRTSLGLPTQVYIKLLEGAVYIPPNEPRW
jgi:hypothetical protein